MSSRIIVTGGGGFIGWHLTTALVRRGDVVEAWVRDLGTGSPRPDVSPAVVDVGDRAAVAQALARFSPDVVIHLAARSLVGPSWDDPGKTYSTNVLGTINVLEAARALSKPPRVVLAGSSAEYAEPSDDRLIAETAPLEPNSPYASSKMAANDFAQLCVRRYGSDIVRFRPFFLIGPRKTGDVCSDFARRIVAIERGDAAPMRVGTLSVVRDMMDVRDGVAGIISIVERGTSGEIYNVCSGRGSAIGTVLEIYRRLAREAVAVEQDPSLLRPLDQTSKIGDPAKLRSLGWEPHIGLEESLRGILEYWRAARP